MSERNIVLIGMPGCGKTTVGRLLAQELGRTWIDTDAEIESTEGRSISEIFATDGEIGFRRIETKVLDTVMQRECAVIATGGGAVTQAVNYDVLKRGLIVFLDRAPQEICADIDVQSRPLLQNGKGRFDQLYRERYPLYCAWAQIRITEFESPKKTVKKIIEEVKKHENHGD